MLTLILRMVTAVVSLLLRVSPGLRMLAWLRSRNGLRWGVPAMLIAVPYYFLARLCVLIIESGGPSVLHLLVLWCGILVCAFVLMGPLSVLILLKTRLTEKFAAARSRSHIPAGDVPFSGQ